MSSSADRSLRRDPVLMAAAAVLAGTALLALALTAVTEPPDPVPGARAANPGPRPDAPRTSASWSPPVVHTPSSPAYSGPAASRAPGGAVVLSVEPRSSAGAAAPPWRSSPETAGASACPPSGVLLRAAGGDAAMGLRAHGLQLVNCGTQPYRVHGYPAVRILDGDRRPLEVDVFNGKSVITALDSVDAPPREITLQPRESAWATLVWRATARDGVYIEAAPLPGLPSQIVDPGQVIDLGDTGRLGVGPWRRDGGP